jgi:hypothetical protein
MARGALRNVPLNTPTAVQTRRGPMCFALVADPRFGRGRRARRLCNSACGLPARHPSPHCSMGGAGMLPMRSQPQTFLPQGLLSGY